jgi:hypothetical protein
VDTEELVTGDEVTGAVTSVPLNIVLQDGFTGEEAVVRLDGAEVFRAEAQTAWEISLATSFDATIQPGAHTVELEIASRGIRASHEVEVDQPMWLGVSVLDEVIWRESTDAFGYV